MTTLKTRRKKLIRRIAKLLSINNLQQRIDNMKKNLEYRHVVGLRALPDSRKIGGLAIAVESRSELMGGQFYETIKRSAVDENLIKSNDIKLYMNHDSTQGTIARSKFGKGSLRLFITDRGLEFETEVPSTAKGDEVLEGIRRGDIDACSFAFMADSVTWTENEDGTFSRDINSFKMVDECSILSCLPAYSATEVDFRSLDDFKKFEEEKKDSIDDNMPEPKTKDYRAADEEQEKEKDTEVKNGDPAVVAPKDEEQERAQDEEKPVDEEENRSEDDEKKEEEETEEKSEEDEQEKEEKSSDEPDEEEDKEEDRDLASYYQSLRSLLK